jgi:short-subunit dehydrogenase
MVRSGWRARLYSEPAPTAFHGSADANGMNTETALITGASSGIGLHLAHVFAEHGHPLVLVAPVEAELRAIADELTAKHGISARIIPANLERPESAEDIFLELQKEGVIVDILVNNAGHGFRGKWWEIPIDVDLSMIRLNIEAVLRLTKFFIQPMIERGRGRLLTTASVAGFEPGPLLAVYHATKAFVLSWSEALATELQDTAITVTALCPGPTDTDFFPKAGMLETRAFQGNNIMAPQDVAKAGYKAMMDGDLFVVPGGMNKTLVAARRFLSEGAQAKMNQKYYEEVPVKDQTRRRGDVEFAVPEEKKQAR